MQSYPSHPERQGEQGFMLVGAIVLIFLVFLALGIAAPKVARELRREREVEAIHRGDEYVRAIQLYYRKFGSYPGTVDQLQKTSNIRFLRQKYTDPMTGKADWRLIHLGEAKTTVKGFFGQPLGGLPGAGGGMGAASSMASGQPGSTLGGSAMGGGGMGSPGSGLSGASPSSGFSLGSSTSTTTGGSSSTGAGPISSGGSASSGATVSSGGSGSSGGIGSQSATTFSGGGAPIVGVGSSRSGASISVVNEQTTYQTWEFIYDPRIEQLKAKGALLGGGMNSTLGSGSSSSFGSSSGFGSSSPSSSSPSSGTFGNSSATSSSGFGSPGTSSPTPSH
ncbi:MAG TPA: type II secretion system protein [Edaphobacter sp.]|nr:type II secretion system protein [Edaphobacter sp.]